MREAAKAPGTVTVVDVVKVADPSKTATSDNVRNFVEIKFNDQLTRNQARAQNVLEKNGEEGKYVVIYKKDCNCPEKGRPRLPELDPRWVELLAALLLLLLLRGRMPGRMPLPGGLPAPGVANVPQFNLPGSLEPAPGIADVPVLNPTYFPVG